IFYDHETVVFSRLQNGIHVSGLAEQVNGHDRCDGPFAPGMDQLSCSVIEFTPRLQVLPELVRFHVICVGIDIDKVWQGACLRDGLSGRDESVGNGQDNIPWRHSCHHQCKAHGICTTADTHTMTDAAYLGKLFLEHFDHGTTDETCCLQTSTKYRRELLFELAMRRNQIQKRYFLYVIFCGFQWRIDVAQYTSW